MHELQAKEAKIVELQNVIVQMEDPSSHRKLTEEETQCSFDEESVYEQSELIKRLGEVLSAREQEGVGLHLATQEME